jgi:hypothetical protein
MPLNTPPPIPEPSKEPKGLTEAEERALHADLEQIATLIKERAYAPAMHLYHDVRERLKAEQLTPVQRARFLGRLRLLFTDILKGFQDEQQRGLGQPTGSGAWGSATSSPVRVTAVQELPADPKLLAAFEREATDAERAFRGRAIGGAMRHYHAARQLYRQLPAASRRDASARLLSLYNAIAGVKTAQSPPRASIVTTRTSSPPSAPLMAAVPVPTTAPVAAPRPAATLRSESTSLLESEERRLAATRP